MKNSKENFYQWKKISKVFKHIFAFISIRSRKKKMSLQKCQTDKHELEKPQALI
jgi:hypothetical protein